MQVLSWLSLIALLISMTVFIYWAWNEEKARPRWITLTFTTTTALFALVFLGFTWHTILVIPARTNSERMTAEVVAGKKAWQKYQCINCHTLLGNGAYYGSDLTRVWNRFLARTGNEATAEKALTTFLQNPPRATASRRGMPRMPISDTEAASLAEFLRWTGEIETNAWPPAPTRPISRPGKATPAAIATAGRAAFESNGCFGCHSIGEGPGVGPDLLGAGAKYDRDFLVRWIREPDSIYRELRLSPVNPDFPEMPNQEITVTDAEQIADYLRGLSGEVVR